MPELPEVETIKLGLQRKIIGLTIKNIEVLSPKSFLGQPQNIKNKKILNVWRRAKILGIDLTSNLTVLFHLKMTGQLVYDDGKRFVGGHPTPDMRDAMPNSHTRVIFELSDYSKLFFNDQRRFGWIRIMDSKGLQENSLFKKLGPEPLEKGFTWEILKLNLLRHKTMPIKVAILDQSVVSGVGNIYASEACFNARIDPRKKVADLKDQEFEDLHQGILIALQAGIKHGGSTKTHFVNTEGKKGYFLDYAFVYGKDSDLCKICQTKIEKIQLRGRGTFFCPNCQK